MKSSTKTTNQASAFTTLIWPSISMISFTMLPLPTPPLCLVSHCIFVVRNLDKIEIQKRLRRCFVWGNPHYLGIQIPWNMMSCNLDALKSNYSYIWFIPRNIKGIIYFSHAILILINSISIFFFFKFPPNK